MRRMAREGFQHFLAPANRAVRSEEHTSELQSLRQIVCRLLLEKKKSLRPFPSLRKASIFATSPPAHPDNAASLPLPPGCSPGSSFFFNATATAEIYTLSLHDALPISTDSAALTWAMNTVAPGNVAQRFRQS